MINRMVQIKTNWTIGYTDLEAEPKAICICIMNFHNGNDEVFQLVEAIPLINEMIQFRVACMINTQIEVA